MDKQSLDTSSVQRPGAFLGRITQAIRDLAVQNFTPQNSGNTLDVGCGNGLFFAALPPCQGRLAGVDFDLDLLREARLIFKDNQVGDVWLAQGNGTALPFQNASFDNIFFLNTLINIPTDQIVHDLATELMRICRPGGRIYLDIRNAANPYLRLRYWRHNRREDFVTRAYHIHQIRGAFASAGFQIVAKHSVGPRFPFCTLAYLLELQAPATNSN
ncbi:MAG: class I SAM-dependent methyltransferase [bacterium]|nr:class I SAM-dependent methyltransferase [bacterium]